MGLLTGEALVLLAVAVATFLLLVDLMHRHALWAANYPPGPVPMPGLDNLLQVDFQNMPYSLGQLRRRFGDVFSLQLAWRPVVVVNWCTWASGRGRKASDPGGWECIRAADGPAVTRRLSYWDTSNWHGGFVLARSGPVRREQRRFSVSALRNFGLGKKSLEQWVTEQAARFCTAFAAQAGRPFSPKVLMNKALTSVSLTHGRCFEYDDPTFLKLLDRVEASQKEDSIVILEILNIIPVLLHIPGLTRKVFSAQRNFMALLDKLVTEHRETWDLVQPPRDLTDAFLDEVEKAKGNPQSSFTNENLHMVVSDPFSAGMVTTLTTLDWVLLLMLLHPDVQHEEPGAGRVQQEIDEVIGQVRPPAMKHQARMPFTTAVVHEVQRFGAIVPLGVSHMTSRDTEVHGFHIPKGTTLILNLSSVLKDEAAWEKPFRFHPEHFLDAQGRFVKPEAFMPFSAGRRSCLGEPLARMELFLFFTCLLRHFSFSVPPGQPRPSDHGVYAFLVTPFPYQLCAVPR
ncbi:LOW QUALITY PROTEIN: cytochrome P450 2D6-like [Trichechus inunguis]